MNLMVLRFKKVYTQYPCTVHRDEASILSPGNMSTKEKSPYHTVNIEKKSVPGEGL